jgi:glycosyltransferase involved in cell wall biosynthesis
LSHTTVAVILPAYNEEATIEAVIASFHNELPDAKIYVINNNSADRTGEVAQATLAKLCCQGKVIDEVRRGKGNAVRRAFIEVEADVYLLVDADLTYPANRASALITPVLRGDADMVVGDRHTGGHYAKENKRQLHDFGNKLVKELVNRFFGASLVDIMSGYRAFSRNFVKNYPILVEGFQLETDVTLHALDKRFRILEVPVEYVDRPSGSVSKLNTLVDGAKVIFVIFEILRHYKPLVFFGTIALLAMLAGFIASIPVFTDWIQFRYVSHIPLAVLASALEIVAVVAMAIGLILDSIAHYDRIRFELMRLNSEQGLRDKDT